MKRNNNAILASLNPKTSYNPSEYYDCKTSGLTLSPSYALSSANRDFPVTNSVYKELIHWTEMIYSKIAGDFELSQMIDEIKELELSFVRIGVLLARIRRLKLWQTSYRSFQDFCQKALHCKVWKAKRLIDAATIVIELIQNGFEILPTNEYQCRTLKKIYLKGDLYKAWESITKLLKPHEITGKAIKEILGEKSKSHFWYISKELDELAREKQTELGFPTLESYLRYKLELTEFKIDKEDEKDEEVSRRKQEIWEEDLEKLATEAPEYMDCPICENCANWLNINNEKPEIIENKISLLSFLIQFWLTFT